MTLPTSQHTCPECQQTFSLITTSCSYVVCPHCDSNLSLHAGQLHLIQKNAKQVTQEKTLKLGDMAYISVLPDGSVLLLDLKSFAAQAFNGDLFKIAPFTDIGTASIGMPKYYTVIGWIDYERLGREDYHTWREYLLSSDNAEFLWLSESDKGWHFVNYTLELNDFYKGFDKLADQVHEAGSQLSKGFYPRRTVELQKIRTHKVVHVVGSLKYQTLINNTHESRLYRFEKYIVMNRNRARTSHHQRILLNQQWQWRHEVFVAPEAIASLFNKAAVAAPQVDNATSKLDFIPVLFVVLLVTALEIYLCIAEFKGFSFILATTFMVIINSMGAGILYFLATLGYIQKNHYYHAAGLTMVLSLLTFFYIRG